MAALVLSGSAHNVVVCCKVVVCADLLLLHWHDQHCELLPCGLQLHTSLGNMVVEYGALPKSNPNRTMLSVRDKQAGSLIDVVFK